MANTQTINLKEIAEFICTDGKAIITYRRKKRKVNFFKITYSYDDLGEHSSYCPRCGNVKYNCPDDIPEEQICSDCNEDEYETIDLAELPDTVYKFLADDLSVKIKLFSGESFTFKLPE